MRLFLARIERDRKPPPQHDARGQSAGRIRTGLQLLYARCLTAMRRDAGFPKTAVEDKAYRVVGFGAPRCFNG